MITLTPAYGRDYKSKAKALADFYNDKDFVLNDFSNPNDGRLVNRPELVDDGVEEVKLRYDRLLKVFVVKTEKP